MKTFRVTLTVLTTYELTVDARTEEEAISVAEQDFEEGIPLDLVDEELDSTEAVEVEE